MIMPDPALYRQTVDVLLAEHAAAAPDEAAARKLSVVWGLYCQVHRFARAAMLLADNGMGQESTVLEPVMLEHTIVLHWIIARGDDGIDAMFANQSVKMRKWLDKTRDTTLEVPQAIAEEITTSFEGIDETKAASIFSDICGQAAARTCTGSTGSGARQSTRRCPRATPTSIPRPAPFSSRHGLTTRRTSNSSRTA
jgi:hypothetical protein